MPWQSNEISLTSGQPGCRVLLTGENSCEWAVWFKAHYQGWDRIPSDFDQAKWMLDHTALLNERIADWTVGGYDVYTEAQNRFDLHGRTATLAGRPDIIARREDHAVIVDAKTGHDSPSHAVMIYLYALPLAVPTVPERLVRRLPLLPASLPDCTIAQGGNSPVVTLTRFCGQPETPNTTVQSTNSGPSSQRRHGAVPPTSRPLPSTGSRSGPSVTLPVRRGLQQCQRISVSAPCSPLSNSTLSCKMRAQQAQATVRVLWGWMWRPWL